MSADLIVQGMIRSVCHRVKIRRVSSIHRSVWHRDVRSYELGSWRFSVRVSQLA